VKLKVILGVLLVSLAFGAVTADARYYMRYGQAKRASAEVARQSCSEQSSCVGWIVDRCLRQSPSRFDCVVAKLHRYEVTGAAIEEVCETVLHWGASPEGYVDLKALGRPYCYEV
jgi:hypothetical protein